MLKDKTKKIQPTKNNIATNYQQQIPLDQLMTQIHQLKTQLKSIKSSKQLNISHRVQSAINLNTQNKVYQTQYQPKQILIEDINYKQRDKKLKMDIELNKLKKIIIRGKKNQIIDQINLIFQLINTFNQQTIQNLQKYKERYYQIKLQNDQPFNYQQYNEYGDKYKELLKINANLESQVRDLRNSVMKISKKGQAEINTMKLEQEFNIIFKQRESLLIKNQQFHEQLRNVSTQLQTAHQKLKIYQNNLQKKQSELLLIQQNMNYTRLQCEKFRARQREIQQLYEENQHNYKDYKNTSQSQIQKIQRENSRLQYQLSLRRNQTEQLVEIQSQKNIMYKEIQQLRQQLQNKRLQNFQIKNLLHQQQKKNLSIESQLYRSRIQCQRLQRNLEVSKNQLKLLYDQVQELAKVNQSIKHTYMFQKDKNQIKNGDKVKALDQIQQLIKKHKLQNTNI